MTDQQWIISQGIGVAFSFMLLAIVWRLVNHTMAVMDRMSRAVEGLNTNIAVLLDRATRVAEKSIDTVSMAQHAEEHRQQMSQ